MVGELNMRHSHATHDLYNRILEGNPPEWTWYVQVGLRPPSRAHVAGTFIFIIAMLCCNPFMPRTVLEISSSQV